jgi:rare lipoprotein A
VTVRGSLAQRLVVLAGIALLAAAVSFAAVERSREDTGALPEATGSYVALAGSSGQAAFGRRTLCGQVIRPVTLGVAHPVLPCGARIYVSYRGKHVLTQVIDRGPYAPGRQFELTAALARQLGLTGVRRITWSYAAAG